MVYSYFAARRGLDDIIGFSCDSIVKWCGYKPNYDDNKINSKIAELINALNNTYIKLLSFNYNNLYSECLINRDKFDVPDQFALIYLDEIKKLQIYKKENGSKDHKISPPILLLLLSYLRLNMLRRQSGYIGNPSDKPEFCYRMYKDIENDIGLSSRYISKAIDVLVKLDLIATITLPRYKDDNDKWHTCVTLFADKYRYRRNEYGQYVLDKSYDFNQELQWGLEYIKGKKKEV